MQMNCSDWHRTVNLARACQQVPGNVEEQPTYMTIHYQDIFLKLEGLLNNVRWTT